MKHTIVYQDKKYSISTEGKISIWKVFPLFAFDELVLGKRKPKETWTEINLKKYHEDRLYIPCNKCGALHSSKIWSSTSQLAYGNWYGLYCSKCNSIIPCVRNYFSAFILFLLSPITYFFVKKHKEKWLHNQLQRYNKYEHIYNDSMYMGKYWVYKSWWNAITLSVSLEIFLPLLFREPIVWSKFFYSLLFFGTVYFIFEIVMSVIVRKNYITKINKENITTQ